MPSEMSNRLTQALIPSALVLSIPYLTPLPCRRRGCKRPRQKSFGIYLPVHRHTPVAGVHGDHRLRQRIHQRVRGPLRRHQQHDHGCLSLHRRRCQRHAGCVDVVHSDLDGRQSARLPNRALYRLVARCSCHVLSHAVGLQPDIWRQSCLVSVDQSDPKRRDCDPLDRRGLRLLLHDSFRIIGRLVSLRRARTPRCRSSRPEYADRRVHSHAVHGAGRTLPGLRRRAGAELRYLQRHPWKLLHLRILVLSRQ